MTHYDRTVTDEDEIDFRELFSSLWAYKILICFICGLCIVSAGFYALTVDKTYSARSTFNLAKTGNDGSLLGSLGGDLGGLAAIAGLGTVSDSTTGALIERVTSREFILEAADELDLRKDVFFNPYDPNASDPAWKAAIKSTIGIENQDRDILKIADWNVVRSYQEFISIEATSAGAIAITVQHKIPKRASNIANHLVEKIIKMTNQENLENVDKKLKYLSRTLADASEQLSAAQDSLKAYSLSNSTQALESFAAGSVMLDEMRALRERSAEQLQAVLALKSALKTGSTSQQNYLRLREAYPLLDQSGFRRIMGISEVISAWRWPDISTVSQVEDSIRDRLASLGADIVKLEEEALRYATSAEKLERLKRDLKVAEATYTVLMEQVKSQSLVAGFTPDNSKIIEIADVPITPSSPKLTTVIVFGLMIGLFLGSAIALVLAMRKGVYFATSTILAAICAPHGHRIKSMRRYRGKVLQSVQELVSKAPLDWARQTVLQLDSTVRREPVFVCDISSANRADVIGRIIAATAGNLDRNAALIDLSRYSKASDKQLELSLANKLAVVGSANGCTEYAYISGNKNIDMIFSKSLRHMIDALMQKHEMVLFTANEDTIETLLSSKVVEKLVCVAHVRKGKTRKSLVNTIMNRGQIEVVYYA